MHAECCICLNEIEEPNVFVLECCNNIVHHDCMVNWINTNIDSNLPDYNKCILCKTYNKSIHDYYNDLLHNRSNNNYFNLDNNNNSLILDNNPDNNNPNNSINENNNINDNNTFVIISRNNNRNLHLAGRQKLFLFIINIIFVIFLISTLGIIKDNI